VSADNVEIVSAALRALMAGDRETLYSFAHPEIVVDATRNVFNPATYEGLDGLRAMLAGMDEAWAEMRVEAAELIAAGERVVTVGRLIGKGKGSGVEVDRFNGQVWTLADGRVVRLEIGFDDLAAALEAAGIAE
jgi:ketosteroid isomerase-like protein